MISRLQSSCRAWAAQRTRRRDRKSTRLNSSHPSISYAVFCLKKKTVELAAVDVPLHHLLLVRHPVYRPEPDLVDPGEPPRPPPTRPRTPRPQSPPPPAPRDRR